MQVPKPEPKGKKQFKPLKRSYIKRSVKSIKPKDRSPKVKKPKEISKKKIDELWSETVKMLAGYKSEISQKEEMLNSHHIIGKKTTFARYLLLNGIALTIGEHKYGIHSDWEPKSSEIRTKIIQEKGNFKGPLADDYTVYEYIEMLNTEYERIKPKVSLLDVYERLLEIKELITKHEFNTFDKLEPFLAMAWTRELT